MMLTKEQIGEIRERHESATPGSWVVSGCKACGSTAVQLGRYFSIVCAASEDGEAKYTNKIATVYADSLDDMRLLGHSRNDISALLAALEAETARADEAVKEMETWNNVDCNTCQLQGVPACDKICGDKNLLMKALAAADNAIGTLNANITALESAIKSLPRKYKCKLCTRQSKPDICNRCDTRSFGAGLVDLWEFNIDNKEVSQDVRLL